MLSLVVIITYRVSGHFDLKFFKLARVRQFLNNFFHIAHEEVAVAVHGAVDPAVGVDAVVAPELADPIVVQVPDRGRHVHVDPLRVLPDEVVPGLLDVPWHADVLGPLLLRVELLLPPSLSEDPQRRPVP